MRHEHSNTYQELQGTLRGVQQAYRRNRDGPEKEGKSPNFLKEVLRPILDELPDLLPGYGFKPTTDTYAMYGEYYRIKAGITLLGGITIKEDFNLVFTPLFHGQPCGKQHDINSMDDLLAALKEQLEIREVACKL